VRLASKLGCASIDAGQSLSRLVEEALTAHLERLGRDKEGQDKEGQVRS
jgi:hypothetical protein